MNHRDTQGGGRWSARAPRVEARRAVRILLASKSPRRRELLEQAGIAHSVVESGVDDGQLVPGAVNAEQWVAALAYLKASAALTRLSNSNDPGQPALVLGADTVVVDRGTIIGQPADQSDAERIIRQLSGRVHEVVTGVALLDPVTGGRDLLVDRATVEVGEIAEELIGSYLSTGLWRGKAGAYNLSERLAAGWPIRYEGDAGTIMGLPITKLKQRLAELSLQ